MSKARWLIPVALLVVIASLPRTMAGSNLTTLASFSGGSGGASPFGDVVVDSAGNIYGTTYSGGTNNLGTIFEVAAGSHSVTTIANFSSFNNPSPDATTAGIILDSAGNIYGTTEEGGSYGNGTLYEVVKGSNTITTLASFVSPVPGYFPTNTIAMDAAGNIYGTAGGGPSGYGDVYEFVRGTGKFAILATMPSSTFDSTGSIAVDAAGNVYGTTNGGGKSVWEVARGSNTFTVLASLSGGPVSGVTLDSAGDLFGTQVLPNGSGPGRVWELAHGSHTVTTLASSNGPDPVGGVALDAAGNLYGTAFDGSGNGTGSVFEVARGSGVITTLASFPLNHGPQPLFGVTLGGNGNLYGATGNGGVYGDGSVFELAGVASVPEPSSLVCLLLGVAGIVAAQLSRRSPMGAAIRRRPVTGRPRS